MIGPEHEQPHEGTGDFEDAVLIEVSDLERGVFGLVRLGRMPGASSVSVVALLFVDGVLVAEQVETFREHDIEGWDRAIAGVAVLETLEPLRRWTASFSTADGGFEIEAQAVSEPIDLTDPAAALASEPGASRYEQLCEIRGEATAAGSRRELAGVGRRVHEWGAPGPPAGGLLRSLYAVSDDQGLTVTALRPAGSEGHGDELVNAYLTAPESPVAAFEDARISTVYDGKGAILKAGLELYMPGDEYPRRASGEARAATVLEAPGSRRAISFLQWSIQGSPGQGSYQVVSGA